MMRDILSDTCVEFIKSRLHTETPFCLFVSFINPHDICYMAIRDFMETQQEKALIERAKVELETLDMAMKKPDGLSDDEFKAVHFG
ncbi:MAG: hypothetical protein N2115_05245 [bacterium]|nr:hypothetical protein [bacterium]